MQFSDWVIFEDNHLLIVNKPPGILSQSDKTGDKSLVDLAQTFLVDKYNKPGKAFVGLPHRIDRPTSGVIIMCKTSKSLTRMANKFRKGTVQKTYWALLEGRLKQKAGTLLNDLERNRKKNMSFVVNRPSANSKKAELSFKVLKLLDKFTLVEVQLITGRHHQIRVQFSHIGHPLKGDVKYGSKKANSDKSIGLHAETISFDHPVTKEQITLNAQPEDVCRDGIWASFS